LTNENTTFSTVDYGSMIESLLKQRKNNINTYDIYFYDNLYIPKFGSDLLELNDILSEEEINVYDQYIVSNSCYYKDKLIGLVIII